MLCAIPRTYFCTLSPLDLAYRDYNVPTDLRNCWGDIGSYIPNLKFGRRSPLPPRFPPLQTCTLFHSHVSDFGASCLGKIALKCDEFFNDTHYKIFRRIVDGKHCENGSTFGEVTVFHCLTDCCSSLNKGY